MCAVAEAARKKIEESIMVGVCILEVLVLEMLGSVDDDEGRVDDTVNRSFSRTSSTPLTRKVERGAKKENLVNKGQNKQ
jgi:hypothetical protein